MDLVMMGIWELKMGSATCSKQEMLSVFENKREDQCDWSSVSREELGVGCVGINTGETGMPKVALI